MISHPILHLDGDAFFVACEVAKNPRLRNTPVVVGHDKGIATALSYEAKKLGVGRGMPMFYIKRNFPNVIILPTDFPTYQCFSDRAMNIVRRHIERVEEYSIDEGFADLTTAYAGTDYVHIGHTIKDDIRQLLGITYSVGIASTKVLAKIASKRNKPNGFTVLEPTDVRTWISDLPVGNVWGIGSSTADSLRAQGILTAGNLASLPQEHVEQSFNRPLVEIWHELNGRVVHSVTIPGEKDHSTSIQDTRSFTPSTADRVFLLAELSKHVENACTRLRAEGLIANAFSFFLKTHDREYSRTEVMLPIATSSPSEILIHVRRLFASIYSPKVVYKSTGVTLMKLRSTDLVEQDLFGASLHSDKLADIFSQVDAVNKKYGEDAVKLASSIGGRKHSSTPAGTEMPLQYLGVVR
ncbi:MAG: DNA polymerase IV [Patescibacteria group bacterium]